MNATENINGVVGPESRKTTTNGDRDGKAPLGEHLAVFRSRFRVSHHGQERQRHA
jgi:hypothetical protein